MGNSNSGRWHGVATKPLVEECRILDINELCAKGILIPGEAKAGYWQWLDEEKKAVLSSLCFEVIPKGDTSFWLRLGYNVRHNGERMSYRVEIEATQPNYGGYRYWFICPLIGTRARKLYLAPNGRLFVCRQQGRLSYQSQRLTKENRLLHRISKLSSPYGAEWGDAWFPRPKGMHVATYQHKLARLEQLENLSMAVISQRLGL